jgi:hypothetical protein
VEGQADATQVIASASIAREVLPKEGSARVNHGMSQNRLEMERNLCAADLDNIYTL